MSVHASHWGYVAASYALVLGCSAVLGTGAFLRLRRAKARLAAVEGLRKEAAP